MINKLSGRPTPDISATRPTLSSLELFTGAGGLAVGTHLAGFNHSALVEWNKDACDTLRANACAASVPGIEHWRIIEGDVGRLRFSELGTVDLVAGGPPCQPFSIAGKHRGREDHRNMIPQFARAIRELAPRAFIMENVRGLLREGFAEYFDYVRLELTFPTIERGSDEKWEEHHHRLKIIQASGAGPDLEYRVVHRLLNAADYGVPQIRHRVFIVGFRADTNITWDFPLATHSREALMHDQWAAGAYWDRHGIPQPRGRAAGLQGDTIRLTLPGMRTTRPWRTVRDAISDLPEPYEDSLGEGVFNHRLIPGARSYAGHTGSQLDLPAKTLKAGDHGVPGGENMIAFEDGKVRYFTVREAARLQTFPDVWRIEGVWSEAMRQLGNAVPVELVRQIAESVAARLRDDDE